MTLAKGITFTILLFSVIVLAYTANTAWAQDPAKAAPKTNSCSEKDSPKVDDQDCAELNDLARQSLQIYIQLKQIQQKYDDARNQDPQWTDVNRQNTEIGQKFQAAVNRIQEKVDKDRKIWVLDPSKMQFVHPIQASAPPAPATPQK